MKLILVLLIFFPIRLFSCEILVDVIHKKSLPSIWDFSQKEYVKKNQVIKINCKLYNSVSVGDLLIPENEDDRDFNLRDSLFGSPIEDVKYKVIKKL